MSYQAGRYTLGQAVEDRAVRVEVAHSCSLVVVVARLCQSALFHHERGRDALLRIHCTSGVSGIAGHTCSPVTAAVEEDRTDNLADCSGVIQSARIAHSLA